MPKKVLISGITGFLGSHIAQKFHANGYQIIGLKRKSSELWRCSEIMVDIIWIDIYIDGWKAEVLNFKPDIFIHAAWDGISPNERNDLKAQLKNLDLLVDLLELAKFSKARKFLGLGSQAEYGKLNEIVSEEWKLFPENAYGTVKVAASVLVELFCEQHGITWYWLRLFSFYGEKEANNWLIPSVINKILDGEKELHFTECKQEYAYLYAEDMADAVLSLEKKDAVSGVYNVSANKTIALKTLIIQIVELMGRKTSVELKFGSLPMRENQSMLIAGDMNKFYTQVNKIEETELEAGLRKTINYYTSTHKNKLQ